MALVQPIRTAVIPVAGKGTRLLPATKSHPKEMLPVGTKPVVQYVVEEVQSAGAGQVLFVTGRQKSAIEDHFDADPELDRAVREGPRPELLDELQFESEEVFYIRQSTPTGLANAVGRAKGFLRDGESFIVALGDTIIWSERGPSSLLRRMVAAHAEAEAAATIAVEEVSEEDIQKYGIVEPEGDGGADVFRIASLVEKPSPLRAPSRLAIASRYIFSHQIFPAIERTAPDASGETQLTDAISVLVKQGLPVVGVRLADDEARYDIGSFESYFRAFVDFSLRDERYGYTLRQYLTRALG